MVYELGGVSCLPLELLEPTRKGIAVTRSFGTPVVDLAGMTEAVATYAARAAEKMRRHGVRAVHLCGEPDRGAKRAAAGDPDGELAYARAGQGTAGRTGPFYRPEQARLRYFDHAGRLRAPPARARLAPKLRRSRCANAAGCWLA